MRTVSPRALVHDPLGVVGSALRDGSGELRVGGRRLVLVATPDGAREVLVAKARAFVKQNVVDARRRRSTPQPGGLMVSADEARHLDGRRRYRSFFSGRGVSEHAGVVEEEARSLVDRWQSHDRADLGRDLSRYAARVVYRTVFAHDPADDDATAEDIAEVLSAFRLVVGRGSWLRTLHLAEGIRFARAYGRLSDRGVSLLDTALGRATEDARLSEEERARELVAILTAAVDTTSCALAWALDRVAREPLVAVAARSDPAAVFAETLRIYPPAWYIGRLAIDPVEVEGRRLAPGDLVWILPYFVHRETALWPEPERFDPGRFAAGVDEAGRRFAFLPFGAGTRKCLGEQLAWLAGTTLLREATRVRLVPAASEPQLRADATLRPASPVVLEVAA